MKLAIDQKVLTRALERGAMAALSDEAQGDTSSFSCLIKSVKITVDENFTVESGTNLLSSKWSIGATKENGFDVKEKGTILVPAKELYDWTSKQVKSKIVLTLSLLKTPEVIKTGDDDMDYGSGQATSIKKVGSLKLVSRDESKTGNKWNLDCYDYGQLNSVDFSKAPKSIITIPTNQMEDALKNVAFSSQPKDYQHIFDSVVLEKYGGSVYLAASDTHRCSIYKLDQATGIDDEVFTETETDGGKTVFGQKILMPSVFVKSVSKMVEGPEISVSYDESKSKVYLDMGEWKVRVTTIDSAKFSKFPSVACLMVKTYNKLGSVPKKILSSRLVSASLVNSSMVLFNFNKDNDDSVVIHAISETGHAPNVSNAPVNNLVKDIKAVWGVKHIMDVIKVIKDDDVHLMVPDDLRSVKIVSEEDKNLQYFSMAIDSPTYSSFFQED